MRLDGELKECRIQRVGKSVRLEPRDNLGGKRLVEHHGRLERHLSHRKVLQPRELPNGMAGQCNIPCGWEDNIRADAMIAQPRHVAQAKDVPPDRLEITAFDCSDTKQVVGRKLPKA
jgi:hypothetical protein